MLLPFDRYYPRPVPCQFLVWSTGEPCGRQGDLGSQRDNLLQMAKRGAYRLNNSVIADRLRENTPETNLEAPPSAVVPLIRD
jgi:hypothetical protein